MRARRQHSKEQRGQATLEFVIAYAGVLLPLTFAVIFTAQILWIWHSVNDFTRRGADYAATHCWTNGGGNVDAFMRSNVPATIDQNQFQSAVTIAISYLARDPDSGQMAPFSCDSDCSTTCIPDTVSITVSGYEFRTFLQALGLPGVTLPNFRTSIPMEGAGCDPEQGVCQP